jgi:hypothetical protein
MQAGGCFRQNGQKTAPGSAPKKIFGISLQLLDNRSWLRILIILYRNVFEEM